jgi:hypothetical protein
VNNIFANWVRHLLAGSRILLSWLILPPYQSGDN